MGETLRVPAAGSTTTGTAGAVVADVFAVPPTADAITMLVAIVAVSTSGPLMASTVAPALAIAFWRNAMSASLLAPWALWRHRAELRVLRRELPVVSVAAGVLLALHFGTWVPSLTFTSVASATALVSTQPIWAALLARRGGARITPRAWTGIAVAVGGAVVITGVDVSTSARALTGDGLALAGGVFAAGYMTAGGAVRQRVGTVPYTAVCYTTTAVVLVLACAVGGKPLAGYPADAWWRLVAVTAGAQFLGHSLFNRVLRTVSPTMVSMSILFEVPGAALIAAIWLHQTPHAAAIPGFVLLLIGVALVLMARNRDVAPSVPVE
jgi:drug/metabolite transporter (DMT)-like permease